MNICPSARNEILIIAEADDLHSQAVKRQVERKSACCCTIVDSASFPLVNFCSLSFSDPVGAGHLKLGTRQVPLQSVRSIWRRRPRLWEAKSHVAPEFEDHAQTNARALVEGFLLFAAQQGARVLNHPTAEHAALNKPFQLAVAQSCSMRTPRTLISNDPLAALEFYEANQREGHRVIFKPIQSSRDQGYTTILEPEMLQTLDTLRFGPLQFQQFCPGRDLRVTVVGDRIFPVEVTSQGEYSEVDWRSDRGAGIEKYTLATADAERIRRYMRQLGLEYGALDFKLLENGELVFLEVNPGGQFLFVEIDGGVDLSGAIAELLVSEPLILSHGNITAHCDTAHDQDRAVQLSCAPKECALET